MELPFSLVLIPGSLLGMWLWLSQRSQRRPSPGAALGGGGEADVAIECGPVTVSFVQSRLLALAAELDELDRSSTVFAKAFHIRVVRSAYQELLADASRLSDESRQPAAATLDLEFDFVGLPTGRREVLEL